MSPLKISLLLRMYSESAPNGEIPEKQAFSPAMMDALDYFREHGLVHNDVMLGHLRGGYVSVIGAASPEPYLTARGLELIGDLMEIEP